MEDISAQELNDSLLKSDLFKCKRCQQILRFPIMYIEKVGNLCSSCVNNNEHEGAVKNNEMETVLSNLVVPCRFEKNGCKEKCKARFIALHENTCNYHSLVCPYTYFSECVEEPITNLVEHFEDVHTHSIIITETDTVKLCFHINTFYNQLNLFVIKSEKFILHITRDMDDDKMYYFVYYVGNVDYLQSFSCIIEHVAENTRIETNASILHESSLPSDKSKATSFNMTLLREIFKDNINVSIRICPTNAIPLSDSYEKLLNCFECPVCNLFMRPPIYQCLSGHSICNKCRSKVTNCPTCRSNYGSTRNFLIENLSSAIKYPCAHRDLGCEQYFNVNDILKHENECVLKPFNCPFSEYLHCSWGGPLNSVATHLKVTHPEQTVSENLCTETIMYSNDQQFFQMKCLLAYGKIFRVCHQRHIGNQNGYWSVQFIGPKGEAKKYACHIALIDMKNSNRKLIRTDICQDMTTQDFMFNHCTVIPLNFVSWFSNNGQLQYYYKIMENYRNKKTMYKRYYYKIIQRPNLNPTDKMLKF